MTATGYSAVNTYDTLGRPETIGTAVYALSTTYDAFSRVEDTVYPTGLTTRNVYTADGHLEIVKNATTSVEYWKALAADERGNITHFRLGNGVESHRVHDAQTGYLDTIYSTKNTTVIQDLDYLFDAIGQRISMSDPSANTITTAYDIRGNKTSMTDPDKGTWTYRYNALGLLVEQTDAKGQRTDITYDVLERMLTRIDDALGASPQTATWTYDTATKGIGKLTQVVSPGYLAVNTYDTLGRPSSSTETIGTAVYALSTTYDAFSRVEDTVYPTGLTARNVYNAYGHLEVVKNATTSVEYWKALAADERGNITQFRLGNGVESHRVVDAQTGYLDTVYSTKNTTVVQDLDYLFDSLGNVKQRVDQFQTLTENFAYDNLNRVTQIDTILDPSTTNTVTLVYDSLGNITNKTDVGAYTYGQAHVACASGFAGPHAVTTIAGTKNATYCYDANGNMVTGDGRTVTYSAFDKPTLIVKGTNSVAITYGPDRARFKRVDVAASGTTTTHYVGGKAYEEIFKPGGTIERKHYIGNFAVVTETELTSQAPTVQTDYLLRDHLGSLDVITDELGAVVTKLSFDAWGKRREANWTVMADPTLFQPVVTTRGFTGHEQLDSVGLVHMNGRVYDAEIGRFLSADPFVQDTENLQAWNRYSYVLNNPLSFTDPDGFFFKKIFKAIGKAFGKVFNFLKKNFKAILRIAITATACALGGPAGCALASVGTSFAFTLVDGGSIGDALKAAAFAAVAVGVSYVTGPLFAGAKLFVQAVGKGLVRGIVGGATVLAQGGSFLKGFASNAIGAAVGTAFPGTNFASTTIVAVAGGFAAKLTGGKLANGAFTAAFAHIVYGNIAQARTRSLTLSRIRTLGASCDEGICNDSGELIASYDEIAGSAIGTVLFAGRSIIAGIARWFVRGATEPTELHHVEPKFLGGDPKGALVSMTRSSHEALHRRLNDFLLNVTNRAGQHMRPQSNNSGAKIQTNFTRPERLNALARFYRGPGASFKDVAREFFRQNPGL